MESKTWDEFPTIRCVYEVPALSKTVSLEAVFEHVDNDVGSIPNIFGLSRHELAQRHVHHLDITRDPLISPPVGSSHAPNPNEDPRVFVSKPESGGRGPLKEGAWQTEYCKPGKKFMCVYVLVRSDVRLFGIRNKAEELISSLIEKNILEYHRLSYVWIDEWVSRQLEDCLRLHTEDREPVDPSTIPTIPPTLKAIKRVEKRAEGEGSNEETKSNRDASPSRPTTSFLTNQSNSVLSWPFRRRVQSAGQQGQSSLGRSYL